MKRSQFLVWTGTLIGLFVVGAWAMIYAYSESITLAQKADERLRKPTTLVLTPAQLTALRLEVTKDIAKEPKLREYADRNLIATEKVRAEVHKSAAVQEKLLEAAEEHNKFDRLLQDKVYVPEAEPLLKKREKAVKQAREIKEKGIK